MCYILIIIYRFILFHQPAFRICLKVFSRYIDLYYFYQSFCIGISENRLESWNGNIGLKPSEIATFEACKMVLKMKNIKKFKKVWKNVLTKHNTNDNITKSSARRIKHRWICGIWRGTEVVITGRSWKPFVFTGAWVRIPSSPLKTIYHNLDGFFMPKLAGNC